MTRTVLDKPPKAHTLSMKQYDAFLALTAVHDRDGRATYQSIADQLGCSKSTVHKRLRPLIRWGLVGHWPDHNGTLRPAVQIVAVYR